MIKKVINTRNLLRIVTQNTFNIKIVPHLSCCLHSVPDTKVAQHPGKKQTKGQVPTNITNSLNPTGQAQYSPPATKLIIRSNTTKNNSLHLMHYDTHSQNSMTEDVLFPYRSKVDVWLRPFSKQPSYMKEKESVCLLISTVNTLHIFIYQHWKINSPYLCSSCCHSLPMEAQIWRMKTGRETSKPVWLCSTPQCTKQPLGSHNLSL